MATTKTPAVHPTGGDEAYVVRHDGNVIQKKLVRYMSRINNDGLSLIPCRDRPSPGDTEIRVYRLSITHDTWIASDGMSKYVAKLIDDPREPAAAPTLAEEHARMRTALERIANSTWIDCDNTCAVSLAQRIAREVFASLTT